MRNVINSQDYPTQIAGSMLAFHLAMMNGMTTSPAGAKVMKEISKVNVYRLDFNTPALPLAVGLLRMLDGYAADNGASARKFWKDV